MVSIVGKPTTFYAQNKEAAGSGYFINEQRAKVISTQDFYHNYVAAYINQIVKSCS